MASPIIRIAHSNAKSGVALYAYAFYPAEALAEDCRAFLDDGTQPDWLCA